MIAQIIFEIFIDVLLRRLYFMTVLRDCKYGKLQLLFIKTQIFNMGIFIYYRNSILYGCISSPSLIFMQHFNIYFKERDLNLKICRKDFNCRLLTYLNLKKKSNT